MLFRSQASLASELVEYSDAGQPAVSEADLAFLTGDMAQAADPGLYWPDQETDETAPDTAAQPEEGAAAEEAEQPRTGGYSEGFVPDNSWQGSVLTAMAGVNEGPTGRETYYNMEMAGVVDIMRGMGNTDDYWVRDDGVKMLGDYVMVAANLDKYPRGSVVDSSLGQAIVCDTGGFAAYNEDQLDIATAW